MQFFPFAKNDRVLKITAGSYAKEEVKKRPPSSKQMSESNEEFIREKEEFLRRITNEYSSYSVASQPKMKKSFS